MWLCIRRAPSSLLASDQASIVLACATVALASARGWEFKPQRINGQPVGGIGELTLDLTIDDLKPADFRDPRKL